MQRNDGSTTPCPSVPELFPASEWPIGCCSDGLREDDLAEMRRHAEAWADAREAPLRAALAKAEARAELAEAEFSRLHKLHSYCDTAREKASRSNDELVESLAVLADKLAKVRSQLGLISMGAHAVGCKSPDTCGCAVDFANEALGVIGEVAPDADAPVLAACPSCLLAKNMRPSQLVCDRCREVAS